MSIEQAPWSWSSWKIPKTMQLHQCWSRFSISSHHEKICANYSAGTAISGSSLFIKIGSGDHRYYRRRLMWRKKATCRLCRHAQVSGNTVTLGGECFRLCFRKCRHVTSYHTRFMWESHGIPMPWTSTMTGDVLYTIKMVMTWGCFLWRACAAREIRDVLGIERTNFSCWFHWY